MRKRPRPQPAAIKTDGWLAIFGDLTSLMLTFFVLLMSMSSIDKASLQKISTVMQASGTSILQKGAASKGTSTGGETRQEQLLATRQQAIRMFKGTTWRHKVHMQILDEKMLLRLPAALLFAPGQATLRPADMATLRRLAFMLQLVPGDIRVEGHTYREHLAPDSPYHDDRALSLARAASVLHVLQQTGIEATRLSLAGYGDAHPVTSRMTPRDIAKNRRVDIVLYRDEKAGAPVTSALPQHRN
jgi:chemotaxis protein MotB